MAPGTSDMGIRGLTSLELIAPVELLVSLWGINSSLSRDPINPAGSVTAQGQANQSVLNSARARTQHPLSSAMPADLLPADSELAVAASGWCPTCLGSPRPSRSDSRSLSGRTGVRIGDGWGLLCGTRSPPDRLHAGGGCVISRSGQLR